MFVQNQLHSLVPRRTHHCTGCNKIFIPEAQYYTLLEMKEMGLLRQDYCENCFSASKEKDPEAIVWKGKIPKRAQRQLKPDERAMDLFQTLLNSQDIENQRLAYVLALYLERKKEMVSRGHLKNKVCYEHVVTGQAYALEKIKLSEDELNSAVNLILDKLCNPS